MQDTKVRFSFTVNGKDTCIFTKVKIKALDPNSKEVKYIFELNGSCHPDSSTFTIKKGIYNFEADLSHISQKKITIKKNIINDVIFKLDDPFLQFAYMGNHEVPVSNMAIVNRRLSAHKTTLHQCNEKKQYPPGTYYVELNTLPVSKFSVDLNLGAVYEIQIPQPGVLKINYKKLRGEAKLQGIAKKLNSSEANFESFKSIVFKENENEQTYNLQPGPYKIVVETNDGIITISEFRILSSQTTVVDLL